MIKNFSSSITAILPRSFLFLMFFALVSGAGAATVWLDDLDLSLTIQGWGEPQKNLSVEGHPLSLGGKTFEHGLGTHAESSLTVRLGGQASRFSAVVGLDDEAQGHGAGVVFSLVGDGRTLWKSGVMQSGNPPENVTVDLAGVKTLLLMVSSSGKGINFTHADWADARFETSADARLATFQGPVETPVILTPPVSPKPQINGATVFGLRPGSPCLFTIAASGDRPMIFKAKHLPPGLQLDPQTGRITGSLARTGKYEVWLQAKNNRGSAKGKLTIIVGDQIALTPPMGWNSWNCFAGAVSEDKVKAAAEAMVRSGLINHGWTYINVDDYWQNHRNSKDPTLQGAFRDAQGRVVPNARFPDMRGLADYIHGLGLKAGLYSSPGPWTCGGCTGSYQHEAQDAAQYAAWGFDYLKYDWCSYHDVAGGKIAAAEGVPTWPNSHGTNDQGVAAYPYALMGNLLRDQPRDIVFSLCQYGMEDVWKWGAKVQGNSWRTTGDITDTWRSMSTIGFNQDPAAPFACPGHWNDPDMLIVGKVGWGHLHPTRLTPNEQYTHISLWCLLAAPLLIGCDMTQLDPFTLNLLENDEVLAVDQDPLGKEAVTVARDGNARVYARDLADGSKAVGLFNLGETDLAVQVKWSDLGLKGRLHVRDLWRQKNLGRYRDAFVATVPRHGVVLVRVW